MDFEYGTPDRKIKSEKIKKRLCLEVECIYNPKGKWKRFYKNSFRKNLNEIKKKSFNNDKKIILIDFENPDEEYLNTAMIAKYTSDKIDNQNFIFYDKFPISRN